MKSASFRFWTRVAVSISYDDNHYTTGTSIRQHTRACSKTTLYQFYKILRQILLSLIYILDMIPFSLRFFAIVLQDTVFQSQVLKSLSKIVRFFFLSMKVANFIRRSTLFVTAFGRADPIYLRTEPIIFRADKGICMRSLFFSKVSFYCSRSFLNPMF